MGLHLHALLILTPSTEREFYLYPVTEGDLWTVRVRAVNRIGIESDWITGTVVPFFDEGSTQASFTDGFSTTQNQVGPETGDVAISDQHQDVTHGDSHTDTHSDQHCDFNDTFHCDCSITGYHADEPGPCHADGHNDIPHLDNHSDDAHGDVAGEEAFSNIEDANGIPTAYVCYYDINGTAMTGGNNSFLDFYVNDSPTSTNWQLAKTAGPHTVATNLTDQSVSFEAALGADYDIRAIPRYTTNPNSGEEAIYTLHGETHGTQPGVQFTRRGTTHAPSRFVLPVGTDLWAEE